MVVVVSVSMLMLTVLQLGEAGMNMCCPVLVPQITAEYVDMDDPKKQTDECCRSRVRCVYRPGGELPPGLVTVRVSVRQSPVFSPSINTAGLLRENGAAST